MTRLERSLLYRVDWTHNRLQDIGYTIQFWFWFTEYAAIVVTLIWTKWGWYGVIHPEYRRVGKRRGTERASRRMYRGRIPRVAFYSVEATLRMSKFGGSTSSIVKPRPETNDNGFMHGLMDRDPGYWDNRPALLPAVSAPHPALSPAPTVTGTAQVPEWSRFPDGETVLFYLGDLTGSTIEGMANESSGHSQDMVSR